MKSKKVLYSLIGATLACGILGGAVVSLDQTVGVEPVHAAEPVENGKILFEFQKVDTDERVLDIDLINNIYVHMWNDGGGTTWPGISNESEPGFITPTEEEGVYTFTLKKGTDGYLWDKFIIHNNLKIGETEYKTGNSAVLGLDSNWHFVVNVNEDNLIVSGGWERVANDPFTSETLRIWVDRGSFESGYTLLHYWNGEDVDVRVGPSGYAPIQDKDLADDKDNPTWLAYYDVNKNIVGCHVQFIRFDGACVYANTFNHNEFGEENVYTSGDNAQIYFLWEDGEDENKQYFFSLGSLDSIEYSVPAENLKPVFEGYFSCRSDADNGYGNWDRFVSTWIKYTDGDGVEHWRTAGDLSGVMLDDFANESDYETGTRGKEISAWDKYQMMEGLYNQANNQSNSLSIVNPNDNTTTIIIVVSVVSALTICGLCFYVIKRRKALNK